MRPSRISILSTGDLPTDLLEAARENGFDIDVVPFLRIDREISGAITNRIHGLCRLPITVAFTSMNAAEVVIELLAPMKPEWKIYSVGNRTTGILANYFGEDSISGSAHSAAALGKMIVSRQEIKELIFFCGDNRRDELPEILVQNQIRIEEVIVYTTVYLQHLIEPVYQGILFFSPGAVESFFTTNIPAPGATLFAIGQTTADEIKRYSLNRVIVAMDPGRENLIKAMVEFYESHSLNADA